MPPARESAPPPSAIESAGPTFETAMARLEHLVEQMENSKLPLEELIVCYEEGTQLVKVCSERLSAAEQRIEMITRDAAGQPKVFEYPPPTAALPAAPPPKASRDTKAVPDASAPAAPSAPPTARPTKNPHEVSLF